jgi:NADH-quinone oxidoreductase subunit F
MDIRFRDARPSEAERTAVDTVLGPAVTGWEGGPRLTSDTRVAYSARQQAGLQRDLLLPALHALHEHIGWISEGGLNYICERLVVPPADAYGVASFYALFWLTPRPPRVVHVCVDLACMTRGSAALVSALEAQAGNSDGACWQRSPCLGLCEQAPAALVSEAGEEPYEEIVAPASAAAVRAALAGSRSPPGGWDHVAAVPQAGEPGLVLLARIGQVDPSSIDSYRSHGGYQALRRALELGPVGVIRELNDSKLVGRGGAAFPAGRKWDAVARQPVRPHYVVCNADESEPGTFKDRVLMEGDPFSVVEAMTIAGVATGCERGFIYLRGEYPVAYERLSHAIRTARARGCLGHDVMGHGVSFDIEIRRGAGAYVCGEETAIFNSIEGFRGEPRNKPPFPVEVGLFGKPTVVNNVETLVNVLPIVLGGGPAYAAVGTEGSTGTKLFGVSGCVVRPGVYEVPFGITLGQLIERAGGTEPGREMQAVLLGGAAGCFVRPEDLDIPLTFEGTRARGATLGSGVVMVLDDTVELVPFLLRIAGFFRDESCGQCVPCRVGTVRQEEVLGRLAAGASADASPAGHQDELALFAEIAQVMRDASICGLGQTAASAIESAIRQLAPFGATAAGDQS